MEPLMKTRFPVAGNVQQKEVFTILADWLKGNRNFSKDFSDNSFLERLVAEDNILVKGKNSALVEKQSVEHSGNSYNSFSYAHELAEGGDLINAKVCLVRDPIHDKAEVSVSLDKLCGTVFSRTLNPRKPVFVNFLIERLPAIRDGLLILQTQPHNLVEGDEEFLAEVLNGTNSTNTLPIIYISSNSRNTQPVIDPVVLAKKVAGFAHVLIEPDFNFQNQLRSLLHPAELGCYGGALRIYWPRVKDPRYNKVWPVSFFAERPKSPINARDSIQEIFNYLISRTKGLPMRSCSYEFVTNLKRRKKIEELIWGMQTNMEGLRTDAEVQKRESSQLMELLEQDLVTTQSDKTYLEGQVLNLSSEKELLEDQLEALRTNFRAVQSYNETQERTPCIAQTPDVLLVLEAALARGKEAMSPYYQERIKTLLASKGRELSAAKVEQETALDEISRSFQSYTRLGSSLTSVLNKNGFAYGEEGGHYKIYKKDGNPDIFVTLAKTPSDVRVGKNFITEMKKMFFNL